MANWTLIITYFLSYVIPLIIGIGWGFAFKFKYRPKSAGLNALFAIFAFIGLTYRNRTLGDQIAIPLIFLSLSIVYFVILVAFYIKGLREGVKFWNSFIWKITTFFAHPIVIYTSVIIISLIVDLKLFFS